MIFLLSNAELVAGNKHPGVVPKVGEETVNHTISSDIKGFVSKKHAEYMILADILRGNLLS
jgi:hypothetical protein